MSEFKPMVKMYTDEPGVSLKLKKGGKVKHHAKGGHESGHKPMEMHHMHGAHHAFESEAGSSPKKPSMMHRMKAMNPNLYAKGGKVAHKGMGGAMPGMTGVGEGMPTVNRAMSPAAIANMAPAKQAMRAAMVKKALLGMKKGGSADHKMIEKLEKELHHHESMKDSEHGGMAHKAHGGRMHHEHMAHGGKVHRISGHPEGSLEHHKHMAKHHAKMHKEGGSAHHKKMCEHHKAMCKGGKYASGGEIDSDMTKTTVKKSVAPYVHMMNDGEHMDHTSGKTGKVNLGNKGGYKHGGKAKHHYAAGGRATGSSIPSETNESETRGKSEIGGTIEGNEHYYENTDMHSARPFSGSRATGGVSMSNAGGFKHGGKAKMHHKADGGAIDKYDTRNTVEGGDWENRPANTTSKGKSHTTTGIVKLANAGGYKHGGKTTKKAYATGGNVNDMGKAVKMPLRIKHPPVANTLQSGTYKRGGNVHHFSEGDGVGSMKRQPKEPEYTTEQLNRAYQDHYDREKAENLADSKMVDDDLMYVPRKVMQGVDYLKEKIRGTPSVPARRRGGSMK